jgi:hypothetical protein
VQSEDSPFAFLFGQLDIDFTVTQDPSTSQEPSASSPISEKHQPVTTPYAVVEL